MKKVLVLVLTLVLALSIVATGCSKPAPAPTTSAPATTTTVAPKPASTTTAAPATTTAIPKPSTTAAPAQPATSIKWKVSSIYPQGYFHNESMKKIAANVSAMTGVTFEVEVFPGGALVPATEQLDACEAGTADAIIDSPAQHRNRLGVVTELFNQSPGWLTTPQFLAWHYAGKKEGQNLLRELYKDTKVQLVGVMSTVGPETEMWANKKITTINDYKGMKIRTGGGWGDILKEFGAAVVSMAGSEIYGGLQRGVIDALEYGTPALDVSMGFHEIAKYIYYPDIHSPGQGTPLLWVNKAKWDALPKTVQSALSIACEKQAMSDYYDDMVASAAALDLYQSKGVELVQLTDDIQVALIKATDALFDKRAAENAFFAKVLASGRAEVKDMARGSIMEPNISRIRSLIK